MFEFDLLKHQANCILLGKIIQRRPDLSQLASQYFENQISPFDTEIYENAAKKRKTNKNNNNITSLDIVQCCYSLLKSNVKFYKNIWQWSRFYQKFLNDDDTAIRWVACHCLAIISEMNEKQLMQVITKKMSVKTYEGLLAYYNTYGSLDRKSFAVPELELFCIDIEKKIATNIVDISGVFVSCLSQKVNVVDINLVNSTYANLRKIALGLNSKKAICLQGSVGSGKTTLIEYVASKTGHQFGVNFVKIQLGDQTDSKMLLGTYRCTDIPGEFVWQPGVLTQVCIYFKNCLFVFIKVYAIYC